MTCSPGSVGRVKSWNRANTAGFTRAVLILSFAAAMSLPAMAQDGKEKLKAEMAKDKTGTNPINFTHDFRLYNEYQFLNVAGDGFNNVGTMEYRHPLANGTWQVRTWIRGVKIEADTNNDGIDNFDTSGLGDIKNL